jgi:subtilisin family serine protease
LATLDVTLCPGPNVTEDNSDVYLATFKDGIVNLLFQKDDDRRLFEIHYLTSEAYHNSTKNNNNNSTDDDGGGGEKEGDITERAKMWMEFLEQHRNSDVCVETYEKDLRWTVLPATDAETGYSMIQVELLDITNNTIEVEKLCFTTLSLAIASSPDVCSIEMRKEAKVQNKVAQWVTQSALEGELPFFRAGLTGRGQVVAISDTGIDRNNCYFWDTKHPTPGPNIDLDNRKIVQYVPYVDDSDGAYGHGTHVAGTVAGVMAKDGTSESVGIAEVSGDVNLFMSCVQSLYN